MNTIIGQNKLVEKLKSYSFNKMPKTLLFIGDKGSGRHYISKCLSVWFALNVPLELPFAWIVKVPFPIVGLFDKSL